MSFRIYYTDGTICSVTSEAHKENVQFIAELRDGRKFVRFGANYYSFDGTQWYSRSIELPGCVVFKGELIDLAVFEQMKKEVFEWILRQ